MAQKLTATMPDRLDLDSTWNVVFTAIDPVSGNTVSGVTFNNANLIVEQVSVGLPSDLAVGAFQLIPLDELNAG